MLDRFIQPRPGKFFTWEEMTTHLGTKEVVPR
jgi:hypothetical protein